MNYETIAPAFITLFIIAVILERGLSVLFQWRWWKQYLDGKGLKTIVAYALALTICRKYGFDVLALIFSKNPCATGYLVTALCLSGGSKLVLSIISQIKAFSGQDGKKQ